MKESPDPAGNRGGLRSGSVRARNNYSVGWIRRQIGPAVEPWSSAIPSDKIIRTPTSRSENWPTIWRDEDPRPWLRPPGYRRLAASHASRAGSRRGERLEEAVTLARIAVDRCVRCRHAARCYLGGEKLPVSVPRGLGPVGPVSVGEKLYEAAAALSGSRSPARHTRRCRRRPRPGLPILLRSSTRPYLGPKCRCATSDVSWLWKPMPAGSGAWANGSERRRPLRSGGGPGGIAGGPGPIKSSPRRPSRPSADGSTDRQLGSAGRASAGVRKVVS